MNRKERRAAASRGDDTMGKSYTLGALPPSMTESPHHKAGVAAAEKGELSPAYLAEIESAAALVRQYLREHSGLDLKWLTPDADRTFIIAGLDVGAGYLADSPDASALLAWLDEKTGRTLSLNMATWALRLARVIPMPPEAP